jgi:hypothetical protein
MYTTSVGSTPVEKSDEKAVKLGNTLESIVKTQEDDHIHISRHVVPESIRTGFAVEMTANEMKL